MEISQLYVSCPFKFRRNFCQVWDTRQRAPVNTYQATYQVTSVSFNDTAEQIFSGGIDNDVKVRLVFSLNLSPILFRLFLACSLSSQSVPQVWDLRKNALAFKMRGHTDTVSGMELSPDGSYLLTNSMDNTGWCTRIPQNNRVDLIVSLAGSLIILPVRCWDVRPFAPQERCVKVFTGHKHTFEMVGKTWASFHARMICRCL